MTGFSDAESSFLVQFNKINKLSWQVQPVFAIELHNKDLYLLKQVQTFFKGKGAIKFNNIKNSIIFRVSKIEDLINIIIPHFKEYPLITAKSIDFLLWCKIIDIINKKDHLSSSGFKKILSIRASLNWGLSEDLKLEFPEVVPIVRPSSSSYSYKEQKKFLSQLNQVDYLDLLQVKHLLHQVSLLL